MENTKLDVTDLVENKGEKVYIDKEVLINFLKDVYYPFDIELEGLLHQSDINEWVSPDKTYNFESSDYNDHECGVGCGHRLSFVCESSSEQDFTFQATQMEEDPVTNMPYVMIDLLVECVGESLTEGVYSVEVLEDTVVFKISKLYFKEFRQAVIEAIHEHINRYYWCCPYTERGFYCPHVEKEDQI